MITEASALTRLAPLALTLVLLTSGCAAWSSTSDLARVTELAGSKVPIELAELEDGDEPQLDTPEAIQELLAKPLEVDTAVQIALLNNRPLRATLRELGIERGHLIEARTPTNPTFEFEVLPERNSAYELRVEYEISDLILAPLRAKVAKAELDAARYDAAAEVIELGFAVRGAYLGVQAAQQRLALGQRALDALAAGNDAAAALTDAGNITDLENARRITAYERGRINVAMLELEQVEARERLHRLLGLHGSDTEWTITAPLPAAPDAPPDLDQNETEAIATSLELAATRSRLEALARKTGLSRTDGWLPDIALDVHGLAAPPEGALPVDDSSRWRFGGGVSLSIPLADRNQGQTKAIEAEFDGLMERYVGQAIDVRSAARVARSRVESAHARARHFADVLMPAQQKIVDETLLQYNGMQIDVFVLLASQRERLELALVEVDTLESYWVAVAAHDALLAGTRVDMPMEPNSTMSSGSSGSSAEGGH
jgi:cobalt-zinc-cadmium efflux system outer membrane protein